MSVTPTGSPVWVRNADLTTYGGSPDKHNYQSQGVVNALTDVGAEEFSRMTADAVACGRTAPFATFVIQTRDMSAVDPLVECTLMTGAPSVQYDGGSPPTGFPEVTRIADGRANIEFDATYTDEYGVSATFSPKMATGNGAGSTPLSVTFDVTGQNVVIHIKDAGGYFQDGLVYVDVY